MSQTVADLERFKSWIDNCNPTVRGRLLKVWDIIKTEFPTIPLPALSERLDLGTVVCWCYKDLYIECVVPPQGGVSWYCRDRVNQTSMCDEYEANPIDEPIRDWAKPWLLKLSNR